MSVVRSVWYRSDQGPAVVPKLAAMLLAVPVVVQTRPQVGCGPNLPLPVDEGKDSLDDDGLDVIFSGWESTVNISDVSHDICVEPVVVPKEAVEPLVLPVVALTRSQSGCAPVFTWPVNDDMISQVGVGLDLLSGRVMKIVDPDVESDDQVLLKVVPDMDRYGRHTGWRQTELDDMMIEKFVLVPEMSPIGSMTSAAEPTFLPALYDVRSLIVLAGGGGGGQLQRECLSCQLSEVNFLRFVLGMAPWIWSV